MAYSTNPNLPKARAIAMRLLINEQLPLFVVANRCGVHRSTVWRWRRKWNKINENVELTNYNRPNRTAGTKFRQAALRWNIPTISSRVATATLQAKINQYIAYYNHERVHLGIQLRKPTEMLQRS